MRECAFCHGFGTYMTAGPGGFAVRAECFTCGGHGFVSGAVVAPGQSRKRSLTETVVSTAIGFVVSLVLTAVVMPAFGYPTTWAHDFWITAIFTVASIVRGYCVRRFFEGLR